MDMSGEYTIPASRAQVWAALNDPEVLKQAIPGCDELIKHSDTELEAKVTAKVGPVKAKFAGNVRLENINAPISYSIVGEGKGGAAGFAKGGADVSLTEVEGGTLLRYDAKAEVGGKLAQIGSRLIAGTSKKMADEFFGKFTQIVSDMPPMADPIPVADPAPMAEPAPSAESAPDAESVPAEPVILQAEVAPEPSPPPEPESLPAAGAVGGAGPTGTSEVVEQVQGTVDEVNVAVVGQADAVQTTLSEGVGEAASVVSAAKHSVTSTEPTSSSPEPAPASVAPSVGGETVASAPAKQSNTGLWIGIVVVVLIILYFLLGLGG